MSEALHELLEAAVGVEKFFRSNGWKFCFIGGVAVQRWGDPRFTQDIDLTLLTGFGGEEHYIQGVLRFLNPRVEAAVEFALLNRVLLARTASGIDVDWRAAFRGTNDQSRHRVGTPKWKRFDHLFR